MPALADRRRLLGLVGAGLLAGLLPTRGGAGPVRAAPTAGPKTAHRPTDLPAGGQARVVAVVDGDTVTLDSGQDVRLTGIQAPKLPLGRPGFPTWPLAEEARAHLVRLVLNHGVTLHVGGADRDRHGRLLAHLVTDDGVWAQGRLLADGFARVYTFADNRALADVLLSHEQTARAAGRGIWALPWYAIRPADPDRLAADIGSFQIVEGVLVAAARVGSMVYLNFGRDWRTDMTVQLPARLLDAFADQGRDPLAWAGARLRVRGWLSDHNGPMIALTHPEALEGPLAADDTAAAPLGRWP